MAKMLLELALKNRILSYCCCVFPTSGDWPSAHNFSLFLAGHNFLGHSRFQSILGSCAAMIDDDELQKFEPGMPYHVSQICNFSLLLFAKVCVSALAAYCWTSSSVTLC